MNMLADFTAMHRELLSVMGDEVQGTITRGGVVSEPLTLYVDDAVQDVGQYGRVIGNKRVVAALNADWLFQRGDVVDVRKRSAKVDEVIANDGIVNTVVLHG
ncbi:MAG: hypothetical protein WA777_01765 [Rhodanobacter sp.]